jgi:Na+/H+-dicarboxylate symporter
MGRTAANVIGNSIATAVVAKWEGEIGSDQSSCWNQYRMKEAV